MTWEAWATLAVLAGTVALLARDVLPPSATVLGATVTLMLVGIITPAQALSGFSNPAPITVAALYVLARAVEKTGALQPILAATLGEGRSARGSLARLLVPSAAASAFVNNTPLVAVLAPQVRDWADRRGLSPSRYLMPLSFAAILGGVCTVIGTSTNIVVSGLLEAAGQPPLGMFEITRVGLPVAVVGLGLIILLAPAVLPERKPARQDLQEDAREFVVQMVVVPGGPLDGKAVEEGGLRHLQGVYLVEVERDGETMAPVAPTTVLHGGDRLSFVGRADLVRDLTATRGLESAERKHLAAFDTARHTFFEAVVGAASPLAGKTLKESEFRGRYGGAVVAIHRAGQRVAAKLGAVRLRQGDTLLILADPRFRDRWYDRRDFLLVSRLGGSPPVSTRQAWIVGALASLFDGFGGAAALLAVVLATIALTELITNNAAAALLFPIAVATALQMGADPRPFAIAIAVAASASFLTPIGYQTNTMVYGPGGYRFGDYARLGAPLTVAVILAIVLAAR